MDFKLDGDSMKALVTKAIFDTMTPEVREGLVTAAIASLLEQPKNNSSNYFGEKKSELQSIFEGAARSVANDVIREKMKDDAEFRAKIEATFARAVALAFEGESAERLATALADQITKGLRLDHY